jgi:flagellin FlaB
MNLIRKGKSRRGVIGIESAIVMIAFVIVAAALAFVVLNMGLSSTQKAKTSIGTGISEASSALVISGNGLGIGCTSSAKGCATAQLNVTAFPIKVATGGQPVLLTNTTTAVKLVTSKIQYDDIYAGMLPLRDFQNVTLAFNEARSVLGKEIKLNPVTQAVPPNTKAMFYFTLNLNNNTSLDPGEQGMLAVTYKATERPVSLDNIRVELVPPSGAPLTIERNIPVVSGLLNDLK